MSYRFDPPKERVFVPPDFEGDCPLIPTLEGSPDFSSIPLQHHHYQHYLQTNFDDINLPDSYFDFNPPKSHFGRAWEALKPGAIWAGGRLVSCALGMPWEIGLIVKAVVPRDGDSDLEFSGNNNAPPKNPFVAENVWDTPPTSPFLARDMLGYLAPKPINVNSNDQLPEILRLLINQQGFNSLLRPLGWRWSATVADELLSSATLLSLYNTRSSRYSDILAACMGRIITVPLERMVIVKTISSDRTISLWPHSWTASLLYAIVQPLLDHFTPLLFQRLSFNFSNKYLMQTSIVFMDHLMNSLPLIATIPVYNLRLRLEASSVKAPIVPIKRYRSLIDCFSRIIREEGISALYSGWRWHLGVMMSKVLTRHLAIVLDEIHRSGTDGPEYDEDFSGLNE